MKIGIIGSGKVGSALGAWLAISDYQVIFGARDKSHSEKAAHRAGHGALAKPIGELTRVSDIIFLTLPYAAVADVLNQNKKALIGKVVVDVTNPITPDHHDLTIGHTNSGAQTIQGLVPDSKVVKAFNAVFAEVYASQTPVIGGKTIAQFYAGDDVETKQLIAEIIKRLGFDAVDAGPLSNARFLEPLSLLNIHLGRVLGFGTQIGFSLAR